MNRKTTLTAAAACSLGASAANATTITSTIDLSLFTNSDKVYIDVESGNFFTEPSDIPGLDLEIGFLSGDTPTGEFHAKAQITGFNSLTAIEPGGESNYVERFAYGDTLNGTGTFSAQTESQFGSGDWGGFTGIAYLGFDKLGNKGWVELDYQATAPGGSITVKSFAYGTDGEITQAGVIPEPAHAAALCALLAGSAAAFSRRRKAA